MIQVMYNGKSTLKFNLLVEIVHHPGRLFKSFRHDKQTLSNIYQLEKEGYIKRIMVPTYISKGKTKDLIAFVPTEKGEKEYTIIVTKYKKLHSKGQIDR